VNPPGPGGYWLDIQVKPWKEKRGRGKARDEEAVSVDILVVDITRSINNPLIFDRLNFI
jgi:hypothetical protein